MKSVLFPLRPGQIEDEFRFTIKAARDLEKAAGCNYQTLFARGQQIEAICLLTCYALRHSDKTMTPDKAADLIQAYVDGTDKHGEPVTSGGNMVTLYEALIEAMAKAGCYGQSADSGGDDARPTTPVPEGEARL